MRKSKYGSFKEHPTGIFIALTALIFFASLGLSSCDAWGDISNPIDPESPNYQGYPTVTSLEAIYPYAPVGGAQSFYAPALVASEVVGATAYQFEIDGADIFDSATHQYSPPATLRFTAGQHSWRAHASLDGTEYGPWSPTAVFDMAPSGLTGLTPSDSATITSVDPPLFQWDDVVGADRYHIQVSQTYDFSGTLSVDQDTLATSQYQELSTAPWYKLQGATYYWRISAHNLASGLWSSYSYPRSVRITPLNVTTELLSGNYAKNTDVVTYRITYTEAETISLNASHITFNSPGTAAISSQNILIEGSGKTTRTVRLSYPSGNGQLGITINQGSAQDGSGNIAPASLPSATIIVDNAVPVISNAVLSSNSGVTGYARNGNIVTLNFSVEDAGSGLQANPTVTIGGNSFTATGTYPNYSAALALSNSNMNQGAIVYTISATDRAANSIGPVQTISSIVYDSAKPTIDVNPVTSNSGIAGYTGNGHTVTLRFTVADTGGVGQRTPEVRIGGQLATIAVASSTSNSVTYNATHTLSGTAVAEGALSYAITAYDNAGNDQTSSGTSTIIYDRTGPTIENFGTSTLPTNSVNASASVAAHDDASGVDEYRISGDVQTEITSSSAGTINFALSSGDGNKTITLTVTDAVGNYTTMNRTIVLDQTGPVINTFLLPTATNTNVISSTVVANDSGTVDECTISGDGVDGSFTIQGSGIINLLLTPGDGSKAVQLTVTDLLDNTTTQTKYVVLDTVAPSITAHSLTGPALTNSLSASMTVNATDTGGSGVASYTISGSGVASSVTSTSAGTIGFTLTTGDGPKQIILTATDNAGNAATTTDSVTLDRTAPTGLYISTKSPINSINTSATVNASSDASGITSYTISGSGVLTGGEIAAAGTINYTLTAGDGVKLVTLTVRDGAGNTESLNTSVTLDTAAPIISSSSMSAAATDPTLTITHTDSPSDSSYTVRHWSGTGSEPSSGYINSTVTGAASISATISGTYVSGDAISFVLIDAAGNKSLYCSHSFDGTAWN